MNPDDELQAVLERRLKITIRVTGEQLQVFTKDSKWYVELCETRKEAIEALMVLRARKRGNRNPRYGSTSDVAEKLEAVPRFAQFLLLLIPKRNREHLIGDLEQEYRTLVLPQYGPIWAPCYYWWQVTATLAAYVWPSVKRAVGLAAIWKIMGG